MATKSFRFQDLEIWQRGASISPTLFQLADRLEQRRLYRFAEQLRGAGLSITNNIADGSGSTSRSEFTHYLNMARRSVFEVANILIILTREMCWTENEVEGMLDELEEQSRMLLAFQRTLKS